MAVVLAAEALELGEVEEAGTAESTFKPDSAENAQAKGVDIQGLGQLANQGLSLVLKIINFARSERKGEEEAQERKENRYRAGIVYSPEESRINLVRKGLIPAYYSPSNIRAMINEGKLPYGWNEDTATAQGFGPEIRAVEFRKKNKLQVDRLNKEYEQKRKLRQQMNAVADLDKKLKLNRALQQLRL